MSQDESRTTVPTEGDNEREVLAVFVKGPRVRVEVAWRTWRGERALDFRTFVKNKSGAWVPTVRGVGFGPDHLRQLDVTLHRALAVARWPSASTG
jgi:hypothetical protein